LQVSVEVVPLVQLLLLIPVLLPLLPEHLILCLLSHDHLHNTVSSSLEVLAFL